MSRYSLAPEWLPQHGILLSWPCENGNSIWLPDISDIETVYCQLCREISTREQVYLIVSDNNQQQRVTRLLSDAGCNMEDIHFYTIKTNDIWVRDYGPLSLVNNNALTFINFQFDAWGKKYPYQNDNAYNEQLFKHAPFSTFPTINSQLVLEGGSIETDGYGTLLTTEHCLFKQNRNNIDKETFIKQLSQSLGINRFIALQCEPLIGDDTDGHIDTLVRFTDPNTLCYVSCDDENDPQYHHLQALHQELCTLRDYNNNPYCLIPLPMPRMIVDSEGNRLPATYANFLIINGAVLMPSYNDPNDQLAQQQLQTCFTDRKVIPIDSTPLIYNFGSIHCASMQIPLSFRRT